jgi:HD-GYP domain-containing protein (c-di-GMP phosphodiesterase class II)
MEARYLPIDIQLLNPDAEKPFDLYILLGDRYLPYSTDGGHFTEETRQKLLREGVRTLHVREEDKESLRSYMNRNLETILRDTSLTEKEKSEIVYDTCIYQLERLWEAPEAKQIEESKNVFRQTVDHVASSNRDAVRDIILMISHETSIYTHSVNVGLLGTNLAKEVFRRSDEDLYEIGYAMFLHDIGKTKVSQRILNKPGRLSQEEWEIMKNHPEMGYEILSTEGHLTPQSAITTLQHHERCNGEGYPKGLMSNEIDELGKICNLVDSYDALLTRRPYKPALSPYKALKVMKDEMKGHFDNQMFKEFLYMLY